MPKLTLNGKERNTERPLVRTVGEKSKSAENSKESSNVQCFCTHIDAALREVCQSNF